MNEEVESEEAVTLREAIGKAVSDTPGAQVHGVIRYGHPVHTHVDG